MPPAAPIDGLIDGWSTPFEGRIARDVVAAAPTGATLVVASSMPVRDVESFAAAREGITFHANRGVNGIDGFVSTVLGIAAAADDGAPTVALVGDLCFLHDSNGLLGAAERGDRRRRSSWSTTGAAASSRSCPRPTSPTTSRRCSARRNRSTSPRWPRFTGIPVAEVDAADGLVPALDDAVTAGGVRVVRVRTDRADNVTRHREVWAAVADSLRTELRSAAATAQ